MRRQNNGCLPWWTGAALTAPFLDFILLRITVLSIRGNSTEPGLFVLLYLQFVPQEVILRWFVRNLRKKDNLRWYEWAGRIGRWAGVVMIALAAAHLAMGGRWETLLLPDLYDSELWVDQAAVPLRWIFVLSGMTVMLGLKATRKKSIVHSLITFPVLFMLIGIVANIQPAASNRLLSNMIANVMLLLIPYLYGIAGAFAVPLFGRKIRAEEEARRAREEAKKAARVPQPAGTPAAAASPGPAGTPASAPGRPYRPPASVRPGTRTSPPKSAPPRDIEQELAARRAAYEARMKQQEAGKRQAWKDLPVEERLRITSGRLFSECEAAATLGGRRQLVYWMAVAVPRLGGLIRQPVGKRFFDPQLPDDPKEYQPLLDAVLDEAVRLLESRDASAESAGWGDAEPETLCAGWYALTCFAAGEKSSTFSREAERLETHFRKDRACSAWLADTLDVAEQKERL